MTMTIANRCPNVLLALPFAAGLLACNLTDNGRNDSGASETANDGAMGDTDGQADTGEASSVTIFDLQQGLVEEGTMVTIENVVVTSPVSIEQSGVFVQDQQGGEFSGIYLYMWDEVVDRAGLTPGDVVTLTGEYVVFYGMSQLTVRRVGDVSVVGNTEPPAPVVVEASDIATGGALARNYQGVVVQVAGVAVSQPVNQYGDFVVEGGLLVSNFFLQGDDAADPNVGAVYDTITGPLYFAYDNYRILPRSGGDLVGGEGGLKDTHTVYDIQQGLVPEGTRVIVEDVVVTTPPNFKGDLFFVMEPDGGEWSGIAVYVHDEEGLDVRVGDVVTLDGRYQEYHDQSQIVLNDPGDIVKGGTGDVTPAVVSAADVATGGRMQDNYQGVLVTVQGVSVTNGVNQYGEFEVDDVLIVDDLFFTSGTGPDPAVGTSFASITGVMAYSFGDAKLSPRVLADLVTD
jgi:DNA/RNA endonuclease YhcR with UshA esterase domain